MTPGNHNYLRLTRIMESMRTLGHRWHSAALASMLCTEAGHAPARIPKETVSFWMKASNFWKDEGSSPAIIMKRDDINKVIRATKLSEEIIDHSL